MKTVGDKPTQSDEKRPPNRTLQKTVTTVVKSPAVVFKQAANSPKTPVTNLNVKQAATLLPKVTTPTQAKAAAATKTQLATKTSVVASKTPIQVMTKGNAKAKITVPVHQVGKIPVAVKSPAAKAPVTVKSPAVKTAAAPVMKTVPQQSQNVAKAPANPTPTSVDAPDQSTNKVVTLHMRQGTPRTYNQ